MKTRFTRVLAAVMCFCMLVSMIPFTAFASDFVSETHDLFSTTTSTIAPGVTQSINYAYAKDGEQMVYFVAKADINRDDVRVQTTYKNANPTEFGMQILREQMDAAKKKHSDPNDADNYIPYYTPVVGVNGDFFNTTTGQPSGAFVMEGVQVSNKANNRPWFAIFEDGTALCGKNNAEWDAAVIAHGAVVEAVGGSQMLVVDGKDVTATATGSYNTDRHCRTMVGVTATGEVVMVALDGRQEPYSCGGTMHELAQIMLEQGCVTAINLDGGGSTTYVARQEGENEVTLVNRPSDGSERSISSGLMIVSTVAPSNVFERASLSVENEYVTPGSTVEVFAKGVSPAGTAADIPEDIVWEATRGTVKNGIFVSDGTVGDAVVSMKYNGKNVGEIVIHVVVPERIAFEKAALTVPYGESVQLKIGATYGLNAVALELKDITYTLADNSIGTVKDGIFTAAQVGTQTNITATLVHDKSITATVPLKLGKGSEVIFDFEKGTASVDANNWEIKDHEGKYAPYAEIEFVDATTGMVYSGQQSMALRMSINEHIHGTEMYAANSITWIGDRIELKNATSLGFWIYIPKEATQTEIAVNYIWYDAKGVQQRVTPDACLNDTFNGLEYSGWHYLSIPITKDMAYIENGTAVAAAQGYKRNFFLKFYVTNSGAENESSYFGDITYYIDDITVDYSDAVGDREAPVFTDIRYADETMSDAVSLKGQASSHNVLSFAGIVHEDTSKDNYTGLNGDTAKAYIDGVEVEHTYAGGIIGISGVKLANGTHTVKFSICDNNGNYVEKSAKIVVADDEIAPTVKVVAKNSNLDRIATGSIYWVDIIADEIENIESVAMKLDLDTMHTWQLDYMDLLYGFEAEYYFASEAEKAENVITLIIKNTDSVEAEGTGILASLPIRVWKYIFDESGVTDSAVAWKNGAITAVSVNVVVEKGVVTYLDKTSSTFSADDIHVDTEAYTYYVNMAVTAEGKAYHANHSYHVHTVEPIADVAATCTTAGYKGRTYCSTCNSPVEWGTIIPATGHTYAFIDGVLKCVCGKIFNGVYTDGKLYIDGIVAAGWIEDSYYVDGVKLIGIKEVEGYYYDFGDDGICVGNTKYTGLIIDENGKRYSLHGELNKGWQFVTDEDVYYYFADDYYAVTKDTTIKGMVFGFDSEGRLTHGSWYQVGDYIYYYYGPGYYKNAFETIDGETYWFSAKGYKFTGEYYIWTDSFFNGATLYQFKNDGSGQLIGKISGTQIVKSSSGDIYYVLNDIVQKAVGLVEFEGSYYYFGLNSYTALKKGTYYFPDEKMNGLFEKGGTFNVDADGKVIIPVPKDGIVEENGKLYYYENDVKVQKGLVKDENGDYYYFGLRYYAVTNGSYYFPDEKMNGLFEKGGTFNVDADGKVIIG